MSIAKFSVKNSVLVNMLMIGVIIFGFISLLRMPQELNPEINFNWVFITIPYPGAAPSESESLIIDPIEAEIQDINDIDEIQSTAGESFAFIMVKFDDMSASKFRERYSELKTEIDKVPLPDGADDPVIDDFGSGDFVPVITVNMAFSIPEDNAQKIADELEDDLSDLSGVAKVQVSGLAQREIHIEVDPVKMNAFRLTFDEIVFALKLRNLNVPGGNITFGRSEYLIRSLGEYQSIDEIRNTIVRRTPNGDIIRVVDVARVDDGREEMPILSRMNNENSITFSISKKTDANSIDVIDAVKNLMTQYQQKIPDGIRFSFSNDNSLYIKRIINVLRNNAISGMILIFLLLYLFLGIRNALLATLGIPVSFLMTFIIMQSFGYTLNGNTLFALVMVLGILVDDAIIILENCHRYRLMGYSSIDAAIYGTSEVINPIFSSIATNIAAFIPLILLPGIMGKFMRIIPLVFSIALIASMFEAFIMLPSHYADWTSKSKVFERGEKKFFKALKSLYARLLVKVLRQRYVWLVLIFLVLVGSIALIPLIGVEMFGEEDFDQFKVLVKFPEGTSLEETDRIMRKFEAEAFKLPRDQVQDVIVNIGLLQGNNEWSTRKNVAQILMQLKPLEERTISTRQLLEMLRERTRKISGPVSVEFELISGGPPVGKPISVKVQGKYLDQIKTASLALQDSIRLLKGTYNISDNFPPGKQEIRINIDEDRTALYGFSTQIVAMNVRSAFDGIKATEFRDGDEEIDVIVQYPERYRSSVDNVLNLELTNPAGQKVALRDMVNFKIQPGPTEIQRFDQKRTIMVIGEINNDETTLDQVNLKLMKIFPEMEKIYPGVTFKIGGQFEEFMNIFQDIGALFVLGILLIFLILGTQFNSYFQPLIILITVPFSLIGAMLGLIISGNPFSIVALFGMVALAGVAVNDAIVMIDFINNRRACGEKTHLCYWRSIVNSGRLRLRPILLTSLTTISGLLPMAFGIGGSSQFWSPLANVIVYGLFISTLLTLFFIPCLVAVFDDIKRVRKNLA